MKPYLQIISLLFTLLAFQTSQATDFMDGSAVDQTLIGNTSVEIFIKDLEETRDIYLSAVSGDKRAVRKAVRHIDKFSRKYNKHPLAIVYKGASLAQRGRDEAERPLNRMRDTEQGLAYIDRGLRIFERKKVHFLAEAEAKLIAAFLFVHLPDSVFHRLNEGQHLVEGLLNHPRFDDMPEGLSSGIYQAASVVAEKYNKPEEQKQYLELALKASPDGRFSDEIKQTLKTLEAQKPNS